MPLTLTTLTTRAGLAGLTSLTALTGLFTTIHAATFGPATGPYQIGVTYHIWNHTVANDTIAPPNAADKLLATIYYPTLQLPSSNNTSKYIDSPTGSAYEDFFGFPRGDISNLDTPYQFQAPTLDGSMYDENNPKPPTVIMSPPSNINGVMAAGTIINFVSNGYTVVVLDHPGEPVYLQLPYGGDLIPGIPLGGDNTSEIILEIYRLRVEDAKAVVRELWAPLVDTYDAPFNKTHFFMIGQSIGGAASAGVMVSEPSVLAGVNVDGTLFGGLDANGDWIGSSPDLSRPFLLLQSEEHEVSPDADPTWGWFTNNQTGYWKQLKVNGTTHNNCYDRPEWYDLLGRRDLNSSGRIGKIWAPRMDFIVSNYVLAFWDRVLGREQDLLQGPVRRFPEVVFVNGSMDGVGTY